MDKINEMRTVGYSESKIAKQLGVPRKVVLEIIEEFRFGLANDEVARERAREALHYMDKHYDILLRKYWDAVEDLEEEIDQNGITPQLMAQKLSALKNIADTEAKRLDFLQKAGLLEDKDLADELAEMERKQGILVDILRNDLCKDCRATVAEKLQRVTQTPEVVKVVE
jgi:hypothetical protein